MDDDCNDPQSLLERATTLADRAVQFDNGGCKQAALYHYTEAAGALLTAAASDSSLQQLNKKAADYLSRAEQLKNEVDAASCEAMQQNDGHAELERVFFLMSQALDLDEAGHSSDAVDLYGQAVELCLSANKSFPSVKFSETADRALSRAEQLKAELSLSQASAPPSCHPPPQQLPDIDRAPTQPGADDVSVVTRRDVETGSSATTPAVASTSAPASLHRGLSCQLNVSGSSQLSRDERHVLAATSRVNRHVYVPFMAVDVRERFAYAAPFCDSASHPLPLSAKQRASFSRWARPAELAPSPCVCRSVDCFSIRQTCVSDCSFVASLAVAALHEKRFSQPLITSILYPRDKQQQPVYNPCGKYMVRLHVNGVARKVIIDDRFPVDAGGRLLCSHSRHHGEVWVQLLEKAYMKMMGGYDFPGSNSGIDLYALTGWIADRQAIRGEDVGFDKNPFFQRLTDNHHKGNVLATVATGDLDERVAEKAGLVPCHAYALLDIREVQGRRLLLLKNPWSHLRWKGRYSELDTQRWTPQLQQALHYDPRSAANFDNGVFWIDYDSVLAYFDVFYLNWSPRLFTATYCHHRTWNAGTGPVRDMYNIGENPQYKLEVHGPTVVWLLLSRHITDIADFRNNREYITLIVYKTSDGQRLYYPNDPAPCVDGVRINSPHYLCKLPVSAAGRQTYTVVVAQYEKTATIHFTLRAYCGSSTLQLLPLPTLPVQCSISGEWIGVSAGGCANHPATHANNPLFELQLPSVPSPVIVQLKGPRVFQLGIEAVWLDAGREGGRQHSGSYRSGFVVLSLGSGVARSRVHLVPSTFMPAQQGPFIITVLSTNFCSLARVR